MPTKEATIRQTGPKSPRLLLVVSAVIVLLATVFGLMLHPGSQQGAGGKMESIRLGSLALETSSLILIAEDQRFFTGNGLDVSIQYYDTGLGTVNALLNSEVDIAGPAAEYVLVGKLFSNEKIRTIGSIDKVDYQSIIGRRDCGINSVPDLKGKQIGVIRGTIQEFYVTRFLDLHGISTSDVAFVDIALSQAVDSIVNGEIDAVITVPPYTDTILDTLGSGAALWPTQNSQMTQQLAICRDEWISQHPQLIERFLEALRQAEEYIGGRPDQAKAILRKKLDLTDADVARIWSQNQFSLSLDRSLVLAMEDEARWMMRNNLTLEKQMPDFADYIYEDGLKAVKPEAVHILR